MKKPFLLAGGLLCGAALLFLGGYLIAQANGKAAVAEAKAQAEQDKAKILEGQMKTLTDQIAKSEAALVKFQADAKAREAWFQSQVIAHVAQATPQQLIDDGSRLLQATDILISADEKYVTLGLESWRRAVAIFLNEEEYRNTREPAWAIERGLLNDQIAALKARAALDAQKDAALAASIADLKDFIAHTKTAGTLEKILWAGAGAGIGLLAGHFVK
jgi:hypothetical protein